jgi:hypothetical protein
MAYNPDPEQAYDAEKDIDPTEVALPSEEKVLEWLRLYLRNAQGVRFDSKGEQMTNRLTIQATPEGWYLHAEIYEGTFSGYTATALKPNLREAMEALDQEGEGADIDNPVESVSRYELEGEIARLRGIIDEISTHVEKLTKEAFRFRLD